MRKCSGRLCAVLFRRIYQSERQMKQIMQNSLFRKKSIERVSSPKQLNDRIRVADPGMWLLLTGILLVLAGICVWGIFGRLNTLLPVGAVTEEGRTVCYVKEESREQITTGMTVTAEGGSACVVEIALQPVQVDDEFPAYLCHVGDLSEGEWVYAITLQEPLGEDGSIFRADIVIESIAPVRFIVN